MRKISTQVIEKLKQYKRKEEPKIELKRALDSVATLNERAETLKASLLKSRADLNALKEKTNERAEILKASLLKSRADLNALKENSRKDSIKPRFKPVPSPEKDAEKLEPIIIESSTSRNFQDFNPKKIIVGDKPWCAYGVRDPFFLMDETGSPAEHDGSFIMFFPGRDQSLITGGKTAIGMARSLDLINWEIEPNWVFEDDVDFIKTSAKITKYISSAYPTLPKYYDLMQTPFAENAFKEKQSNVLREKISN